MGTTVTDPRGEVWTVRRRWVPRLGTESLLERFRGCFRRTREWTDLADLVDPGGLDLVDGGGVLTDLTLVLALILLIFVGFSLLVALLDVVFVLLLALVGIVGRVLFRRPWVVEARPH